MLSHLHPLQHWWEILDFTFFTVKPDGHGGIYTYYRTFFKVINVLVMIIPEYLSVNKNNSVQNMINKPENPRITLPKKPLFEEGIRKYLKLQAVYCYRTANSYVIYPWMPISFKVKFLDVAAHLQPT